MKIEWNDEFKSGNPIIDFQHRLLFKIMSRIMDEAACGDSIEAARELVHFFDCYFTEHFGDEESIMDEMKYPRANSHKKEHDKIRTGFVKYKAQLELSNYDLNDVQALFIEVVYWMTKHMHEMDLDLIRFLKKSYELPART